MESDLRGLGADAAGAILFHDRRIPTDIILSGTRQGWRNLPFLGISAKQRFGKHGFVNRSM